MLTWLWKRLSDGGPGATVSGRALSRFPEAAVERLLGKRVLVERRRADTWPVCPHCECGLDGRPIREIDGQLQACCPQDPAADKLLTEDDLRRFGIGAIGLVGAIAASGGFAAPAQIAEGLWSIGQHPSGRCVFLTTDIRILNAPGAILAVKSAAGAAPITVLSSETDPASELRLREAGLETAILDDCLIADNTGSERLLLDRLSPRYSATRLRVSRHHQSAEFDDRRLDLTPQMFALFRMLAEQTSHRDPVLRKEAIEAQTGRAANEIIRDLRRALIASGLKRAAAEALVVTVRGYGYRLGLSATEIDLEG